MRSPLSSKTAALLILCVFALFAESPVLAQTIPSNTTIFVRLGQPVSSQSARENQRVKAGVAQNVTVKGHVLIPKGSLAAVFVEKVQPGDPSGKSAELLLRLDAITVGGRAYPVSALYASLKSVPNKAASPNAGVAGARATGTPVKTKATGPRAAASTGTAAGSKGADSISEQIIPEVSFPSATVLTFRLTKPVQVK